jgi:Mor family transcriptional regulator
VARYRNAAEILPENVLALVQRYAAGEQLYIPLPDQQRTPWGARSGTRAALAERNTEIRQRRLSGASLDELAQAYHLSAEAIRKILRTKEQPAVVGA